MFKRLLSSLTQQRMQDKQSELYRNFLRHEAQVGGTLFGPVPNGGRREFFCLDRYTWVWHEEWIDENGQHQAKTTRYDVRSDNVFKVQDGQYQQVTDEELKHFYQAVLLYEQRVNSEIYSFAI